MRGLAMQVSPPRVMRYEALPAGNDRLTIVAISTCLVLALMSFWMMAIS
jgi:hypothetical protein